VKNCRSALVIEDDDETRFQVEEPFLHDKIEGGGLAKTIGPHALHNTTIADLKSLKGCFALKIDSSNGEALVPSFLAQEAA
jgi:hypothetical protein